MKRVRDEDEEDTTKSKKRSVRIKVGKDEIFRFAYAGTNLGNNVVRFATNCNNCHKEYTDEEFYQEDEYDYNGHKTSVWISCSKKVAVSMDGKGDRRLEFAVSQDDKVEVKKSLVAVIDHITLSELRLLIRHDCDGADEFTCLTNHYRVLQPYLDQESKRRNPLKLMLKTRYDALTSNSSQFNDVEALLRLKDMPEMSAPSANLENSHNISKEVFAAFRGEVDPLADSARKLADKLKNRSRQILLTDENPLHDEILLFLRSSGAAVSVDCIVEVLSLLEFVVAVMTSSHRYFVDALDAVGTMINGFKDSFKAFVSPDTQKRALTIFCRFSELYLENENAKLAKSFWEDALKIAKEGALDLKHCIPDVLLTATRYHLKFGPRHLAISNVSEALHLIKLESPSDQKKRSHIKALETECTLLQGQQAFQECKTEKAMLLFREVISYCKYMERSSGNNEETLGNRAKLATTYGRMSTGALQLSNFHDAEEYCTKAQRIWEGLLTNYVPFFIPKDATMDSSVLQHARIAECLYCRGNLALMTGHLTEALRFHRTALAIRRKVLMEKEDGYHGVASESDRRVAQTYFALGTPGSLLEVQGEKHLGPMKKVTDANELLRENLKADKLHKNLAVAKHIPHSVMREDLETLWEILNQYDAVREDNEILLKYQQTTSHMLVASAIQRVGDVAVRITSLDTSLDDEQKGKLLQKAWDHYQRALDIRLGKDGYCSPSLPAVAATFDCLGKLSCHRGEFDKAKDFFQKAEDMRLNMRTGIYCDYQDHHPDVAASRVYLGALALKNDDLGTCKDRLLKARGVYRKALLGWSTVERYLAGQSSQTSAAAVEEEDHQIVKRLQRTLDTLDTLESETTKDEVVFDLLQLPNSPVLPL